MRLDIITIFPEYFAPLDVSLIGKAVERGDITVALHDLRAWTCDPHRTVDDTPFGGGPGMVMRPEPWGEALDEVLGGITGGEGAQLKGPRVEGPQLVVPTPAGALFNQEIAAELSTGSSHAGGMRGSTRASRTTRASWCPCTSCRSATMCWPEANRRCW